MSATSRNLAGLQRLLRPATPGASARSFLQRPWRPLNASMSHRDANLSQVSSLMLRQALRGFSATPTRCHGAIKQPKPGEELYVTFIDKEGHEHKLAVCAGDSLLDIAQAHDLEMEGACGGSVACSTCHVIVDEAWYDKTLPEEGGPDDDEADMLDLAFGLTDTSRLGCQIKMSPKLDGLRVKLPPMTRNIQAANFETAGQNKASEG